MSDITDIPNQSTKDQILATSLDLFANQGYHKTSINQIAKTVGVSKSLIYNYFESKDHLLASIVEDFIDRSAKLLPEGSLENLESVDELVSYLQKLKIDFEANTSYYRLLILLTLQGTVKEIIMTDIMQKQKLLIPQFNSFFQKHRQEDPETITYLFGAVLDGIFLHYLYMEGNYPLDKVFDAFISQLKSFLQP